MKKTILPILFYLLVSANTLTADSSKTILLTTQEWNPYQTYENNVLGGFAVERVRCIMEKIGRPYEIRVYPWKRAQKVVSREKAHGFFSASKNANRDSYAVLSKPIASQTWNWYLLKENRLSPKDESFKKEAKVVAMWGSNMLTWLKESGYQINGTSTTTDYMIRTLLLKRNDAILANELVANHIFKEMNLPPERFKRYVSRKKPLGVYWSKKFLSDNPGFLEKFNQHIKGCISD